VEPSVANGGNPVAAVAGAVKNKLGGVVHAIGGILRLRRNQVMPQLSEVRSMSERNRLCSV
jgi:hypothetical protein